MRFLGYYSCKMSSLVALLFLAITANAVVSPVSLNSDISIVIHNDLQGNFSSFGLIAFNIDDLN
jgi:hypothetical protein